MNGSPAAVPDQRFSKDHRLRRRREFLRVYEQGKRGHGQWAVVFCWRREDEQPWRVGFTVTRKTGGAVVRNRLRRRLREFFRRRVRCLPAGWDFVINLRPSSRDITSAQLDQDLARTMRKLGFAVDDAAGATGITGQGEGDRP